MQLSQEQLSLLRNTNSIQMIQNIDPRKVRRQCLREYIQSFVVWLYTQNSDFAESLTHEEIINYFLEDLRHPLWFRLFLKVDPFNVIVRVDSEIRKYINHAYELEGSYFIYINPSKSANYTSLDLKEHFPRANTQQIESIKRNCDKLDYSLLPWDLNNITTKDWENFIAVANYALALKRKGELS